MAKRTKNQRRLATHNAEIESFKKECDALRATIETKLLSNTMDTEEMFSAIATLKRLNVPESQTSYTITRGIGEIRGVPFKNVLKTSPDQT